MNGVERDDQLPGDDEAPSFRVDAVAGPTGIRKSITLIEMLAAAYKRARECSDKDVGVIAFFVPRHMLGEQAAGIWRQQDLSTTVIYARTSKDPRHAGPDKADPSWCRPLDHVEWAQRNGLDVETTCCRRVILHRGQKKEWCCPFLLECGFQAQFRARADVYIMAHQFLGHEVKKIGRKTFAVVIDEGFIEALTFTWSDDELIDIDDLERFTIIEGKDTKAGQLQLRREQLAKCLKQQVESGNVDGVMRDYVDIRRYYQRGKVWSPGLTEHDCNLAIKYEFALMPGVCAGPGLHGRALQRFDERHRELLAIRRVHLRMVEVWRALRDMLQRDDVEVSGRLYLKRSSNGSGRVMLGVRGIRPIVAQWQADTIIIDATLPDVALLRPWYPQVKVVGADELEVDMPDHVRLRLVARAPVSRTRLIDTTSDENRRAIRDYELLRWLQAGKPKTLIGCQLAYEQWLMLRSLPANVHVRHFNDVAGENLYRDVGLLVAGGRTAPGPRVVEDIAGAISGQQPQRVTGRWYPRAIALVQLRDGSIRAVPVIRHPDPIAEMVRWLKHDASFAQLVGRARPFEDERDGGLVIDMLYEWQPPWPVDEVLDWESDGLAPSPLVAPMALEGFVVRSPAALTWLWPDTFKSLRSANRAWLELDGEGEGAKATRAILEGWHLFTVQRSGPRQKWLAGWYDPERFASADELRKRLEGVFGAGLKLREG